MSRNTGEKITSNQIKKATPEYIKALVAHPDQALAVNSNLAVMHCLDDQIDRLEQESGP